MEHPDYLSAKRYSDIMKTMWFTFFYGSIIPIGPVLSCIGLSFYYYIDLYNILTRRTVKESISKELSEAMIEMLEGIIFCSAIGEMIMSYAFYGEFSKYDILLLCMAIIYSLLPMEEISEKIFPTKNEDEV